MAQIETEVITSKGGSYIEDFLAVFRFGTIDGVLAVGGDGTFSQVVNGKSASAPSTLFLSWAEMALLAKLLMVSSLQH